MQIHNLDLHHQQLPQVIAAYLVTGPESPVLVETGPGSTAGKLTEQLAHVGFTPGDIKHVIVTHIHFDHAGAAGWLVQQGAHLYVHHIGVPHLIDPSRLMASAARIYGDQLEPLWGQILPIPPEKITAVYGDDLIEVAGLSFRALDTPGHARHHHCFLLEDIAFIGDAAGVRLPRTDFIELPAPPPEFELEVWQGSVDLLLAQPVSAIYPTHFGRIDDVSEHLESFRELLGAAADFVRVRMESGMQRDDLVAQYQDWSRQRSRDAGVSEKIRVRYETANPLYMSVDGIMRYWRNRLG